MQEPTWQCVLICWGDKYSVELVNHQFKSISETATTRPRMVLITDRERPGLMDGVSAVNFDPFFLQDRFRGPGCQAKLTMFAPGVLPDDLPTIFIDLDTAVFGDMGQAIDLMETRASILMLQSVVLPFGWAGRFVYWLTNKKRYARGNSSIVVFHPGECGYIAETFRELYEKNGDFSFRPMIADERFISWVAQPHIRRLPSWFAVKFLNEYMHTGKWLVYLKGALPWIVKRREGLVAVTLPGDSVKPERLMEYKDGDALRADKNRWILWNKRALGTMGDRLHAYYAPLMEKLEAEKTTDSAEK